MKALLAVPLALLVASPVAHASAPFEHDGSAIVRVACTSPEGDSAGTAVKISRDTYITAAHVVDGKACDVGGAAIVVTSIDLSTDYATFTGPASGSALKVSCKGFSAGKVYLARGYAWGEFSNLALPWLASGASDGPWHSFVGEAIPGMSGGSLIDRAGNVVGIVNMRWPARALPLASTPLCP